MKINNDSVIVDISQYIKARDTGAAGKNTSNQPTTPGDIVQISDKAKEIAGSRAERIASLKTLVETGAYKVDPGKVAASIIKHDILGSLKKDM